MTQSNDEINILDFFRKIGDLFGKLFSFIKNSIGWVISVFFKNILLILFFSVSGFAAGCLHYYYSKPIYGADLILSSGFLQNDMCAEIIDNLQWQVEDKNPEMLVKQLGISIADAKKIVKIEFRNYSENEKLLKKYEDMDTIILGLPFRIHVLAKDNDVFEVLQPALINYFDKNPTVIRQKNTRHTFNNLMIDKIEKQLTEIDSLKKTVATSLSPRGTQNGFVFGQPIDPLNIYREGINLYVDEINKKSDLLLTEKNMSVLNDFVIRERPYRPKLLLSLGISSALGIAIGFLIAYIKAIRLEKEI